MKTLPARHISVAVGRPPAEVYAFASRPENLPRWAGGLSGTIARIQGEWFAESPMGRVKIRFVEANALGVLDHEVTLPSGEAFYNPLRVLPNFEGSEVVFTLYRRPEQSDTAFAEDAARVEADLRALKEVLEG